MRTYAKTHDDCEVLEFVVNTSRMRTKQGLDSPSDRLQTDGAAPPRIAGPPVVGGSTGFPRKNEKLRHKQFNGQLDRSLRNREKGSLVLLCTQTLHSLLYRHGIVQ